MGTNHGGVNFGRRLPPIGGQYSTPINSRPNGHVCVERNYYSVPDGNVRRGVAARHGRKSILIASQIPVEQWPGAIGEPTIAEAVLDRIVHNAYRIDLKGESQRKRNKPPPLEGGDKGTPA